MKRCLKKLKLDALLEDDVLPINSFDDLADYYLSCSAEEKGDFDMSQQFYQRYVITQDTNIKDAIRKIDETGREIALVCENEQLIGLITDSDIRRAILKGIDLNGPVSLVMNRNYHYAWVDEDRNSVYLRMKRDFIRQMPVLNENRELVNIYFLFDLEKPPELINSPVLIMAGGLGSRLHPLTNNTPKPMLLIGGKPLLETIIDQLKGYGFVNILLSVNYQKEVIMNYFQDGRRFGVNIRYIEETRRMGTAGAICLAQPFLNEPFFVINGDVLTKVNFKNFLDFHLKENVSLTVAARSHGIQIPYGVIEMDGNRLKLMKEKPRVDFFINAGMYCLNPEVMSFIPKNRFFDMTELIDTLLQNQHDVASFPIHEYWMDIGQLPDYKKANEDYVKIF